MKQKDNLEYHAVHNFIVEYNRSHKRQLQFVRRCNPPMPDTLCLVGAKEIGIEVAHIYGTGVEASMRLGNRKLKDFPHEIHVAGMIIPLDVRALNSLNEVLANKATRRYASSCTWLLIRNAFALWSLTDYRSHKTEICVPADHPFYQIWLICDRNSVGQPGIMKLA